jgi:hypothetical protein
MEVISNPIQILYEHRSLVTTEVFPNTKGKDQLEE